jgi:hypothetical protein
MSDIKWTWQNGEPGSATSMGVGTGATRTYFITKTDLDGPDKFPWLLMPPYEGQQVVRYTNAGRAMEGAQLWEDDPEMFVALARGYAPALLKARYPEAQS